MALPLASRTLALLLNLTALMIPVTRRTTAAKFTTEIRPISVPVITRSQAESRSIRPGSPMTRMASSATRTAANAQRASPFLS